MAEEKAVGCARLSLMGYPQKKGGAGKKKKEAKKKNVTGIWKTEGVSHIPARQANNKLINLYL